MIRFGTDSRRVRNLRVSAPFLGRRHLSDSVLWALIYFDSWYSGQHLIFGLALGLLEEIPERIDKNVISGRALFLFGATDFTYPTYGGPILGSETNRCSLGVIRDVLLSRAHGLNCIDCIFKLLHYYVIVQ